jgi:hypothetical protein
MKMERRRTTMMTMTPWRQSGCEIQFVLARIVLVIERRRELSLSLSANSKVNVSANVLLMGVVVIVPNSAGFQEQSKGNDAIQRIKLQRR